MNSNKHAEGQVPTRHELGKLIVRRVKACDEILKAGIVIPDGYAWANSDDRLTWWCGCPVNSSNAGVSLFTYRLPVPGLSSDDICADWKTIRAEIRLFMPEAKYREGNTVHTYRKHSGDPFSAHIWVKTGPHWAFQSTSHLADREQFVYADTLEVLCAEIVGRVNTALNRAVNCIAQQSLATAEEACV
ncbi:MAG TPA: hypothetical protein VJ846_03820 [Sphingomicrobium sp.]|nr:hypothetical protein [Sphingomicrobium sp.]